MHILSIIEHTSAWAVQVERLCLQERSVVSFSRCNATQANGDSTGGGCAFSGALQVEGAFQTFDGCASSAHGGAMLVRGPATFSQSAVHVRSCKAQKKGGGFLVLDALHVNGSIIQLTDTRANDAGGGVRFGRSFRLQTSEFLASACSAGVDGGGLSGSPGSELAAEDSNMSFTNCTAGSGAGIKMTRSVIRASGCTFSFAHDRATVDGGGMELEHGNFTFEKLDPVWPASFLDLLFFVSSFNLIWIHASSSQGKGPYGFKAALLGVMEEAWPLGTPMWK